MKNAKRLHFVLPTGMSVAVVAAITAAPALAGTRLNHSEPPLGGRTAPI